MNHRIFTLVPFALLLGLLPLSHVSAECASSTPQSQASDELPTDLTEIGLEKLLSFDVQVTSPSKKAQSISEVTSAIYVLSGEDIRRSGATHVAEALRLVPGVQVARIDKHRWAITVRGLNSSFAKHLLVLLDGQSVFSPIFNGVFWDQYELDLNDIDRIEVIRGPGAAVWGSNAVNGVINIITCSAHGTQGTRASLGGGSETQLLSSLRYGGKVGEDHAYRVYGRFVKRDDSELSNGDQADDTYDSARAGIRVDSNLSKKNSLTLKADGFYSNRDLTTTVPSLQPPFVDTDSFSGDKKSFGANLLGRFERNYSENSNLTIQGDYFFEKQTDLNVFPLERHTLHFDIRHRFSPIENHDTIWGGEYRFHHDSIEGSFADDFSPESRKTDLVTWFIQDEITLIKDRLRFIVGTKLEHNDHTDFEYMPNARVLWTPNKSNTIWAAVSRAISNPSRVNDDVIIPLVAFPEPESGLTGLVTLFGDRDVEAEELTAFELGYRLEPSEKFNIDVSGFYNLYNDFITSEASVPFVGTLRDQSTPALILPLVFDNKQRAESFGAELALQWQARDWWKFIGTYSYLHLDIINGSSTDASNSAFFEGVNPEHTFNIRSHIDLLDSIELDQIVRYVGGLDFGSIDSYFELDLRAAYKLTQEVSVSVTGRNLLNESHQEFQGTILPPPPTDVQRSVYGQVDISF